MKEKAFFGGLDLLHPAVVTAAKMPRAAIVPTVMDKDAGYLNAAPYSGMLLSTDPMRILFGVKSQASVDAYRKAEEFTVAVPNRNQIDTMWVMALTVPRGICEIELAGWHPLTPRVIQTPGIDECLLNLECRKVFFHELPHGWRAIVIGEVVGVHIDASLLHMSRPDSLRMLPMHEAGTNPNTGYYGPSVLSGEMIPSPSAKGESRTNKPSRTSGKVFLNRDDMSNPENASTLMKAMLPRPCYLLTASAEEGKHTTSVMCSGGLGSSPPTIQVPLEKGGALHRIIEKTGEFVVSIPNRSLIRNIEKLESDPSGGIESAGLTRLRSNVLKAGGVAECPVNIDGRTVILEDIPGSDLTLLVGRSVGISLDQEIHENLNVRLPTRRSVSYANQVYASFLYRVLDEGAVAKWVFQDSDNLSVRPLPSWGSRHGGWWGYGRNPSMNLWFIELVQEGLLTEREMGRITNSVRIWNNGNGPWHLHEFFDVKTRDELRGRLTRLLKMMAWAHRDLQKWDDVKEYLCSFPAVERDQHDGPLFHESWNQKTESGMGFVW